MDEIMEKIDLILIELYKYYIYMEGYGAGHAFHIVIDDNNFEDGNIEFCRSYLPDRFKHIVDMILELTYFERYYLIGEYYDEISEIETYNKSLFFERLICDYRDQKINDVLNDNLTKQNNLD